MGKPYGLNSVIHKTYEYSYHLLWSRAILHASRQALREAFKSFWLSSKMWLPVEGLFSPINSEV